MTRIVIADDHPIFRRGLRDMIEEMPGDHAVVGEAEDGAALLQQVRVLRPDVAVVDLAMPRVDGFQFMERLGSAGGGGVAVIVLSMYADEAYLDRALALGARGYVLKDDASDDLSRCLAAVVAGETYISPRIGRARPSAPMPESGDDDGIDRLTPVQRSVLRHLSQHKTSKEIADELGLSYRTVQNHRARIADALGLRGRNTLLAYAVRNRARLR
ncbi:MAG: response regulator transcription factor [Hyphomicrobiales bacterium]|nr:response regulator transcription factor [Hyphomicrobiales bacterium]MCP5370673.1 response regulator transcription factor [Hyphomicrobiales bacterium]